MTSRRQALAGILAFALASSLGTPARADDEVQAAPATAASPAEEEARAHVRRGLELFDDGDYPLALVELERAYQIAPSYKLLYNIGQVHFQLGQYARAQRALKRYLDEGGSEIPPTRRAEVERDLAALVTRVATITVQVNVPDADVVVNEQSIGRAPLDRAPVEAGAVRVQISKPGYETQTRAVKLAGGDETVIRIELVKVQREVIVTSEGVPTGAVVGWITTGVLAAGAVGTGLAASSAANEFETMRTTPITGSAEQAGTELDRQGDRADALALTTDILIGAAVVAAGVSLWLTLRGKPKPGTPAFVTFW